MQQTIIEGFPHAQISVNIVWIDMLAGDSEAAARQSAQIVRDPRVGHFHDPQRRAGDAIAEGLLMPGAGPAWDIYLFYKPGDRWSTNPPMPCEWWHQLGGGKRADPSHFRWGEQLVEAFFETMQRLTLHPPTGSQPGGGLVG